MLKKEKKEAILPKAEASSGKDYELKENANGCKSLPYPSLSQDRTLLFRSFVLNFK
jgi:hypothetical protein